MNEELLRETKIMFASTAWKQYKAFCNERSGCLVKQATACDTLADLIRQQQLIGAAGEASLIAESYENQVNN
jgi:hypothetical protein